VAGPVVEKLAGPLKNVGQGIKQMFGG
jgi:hypothetical protein